MTLEFNDRIDAAHRGENPSVMARMRSGFAVIGDTQHLPGYSLLLYDDPSLDHLTDLDGSAERSSSSTCRYWARPSNEPVVRTVFGASVVALTLRTVTDDRRLPDDLVAFLAKPRLAYDYSKAEPEKLDLRSLDAVELGEIYFSSVEEGHAPGMNEEPGAGFDTHIEEDEEGYYIIPAVDLIESCTGDYTPNALFAWNPSLGMYATWDSGHFDILVFQVLHGATSPPTRSRTSERSGQATLRAPPSRLGNTTSSIERACRTTAGTTTADGENRPASQGWAPTTAAFDRSVRAQGYPPLASCEEGREGDADEADRERNRSEDTKRRYYVAAGTPRSSRSCPCPWSARS